MARRCCAARYGCRRRRRRQKRIVHLASFALSSFLPTIWQALTWRPDVIWTVEPTTLCAPTALLAARLGGARACLHVQDLEIDAACTLCMLADSRLFRTVRAAYGWLLRRFDLVSTISRRMRRQLASHGLEAERLCLFPNWVDTSAIRPLEGPSRMRGALGFGDDQVIALYAGNMASRCSPRSPTGSSGIPRSISLYAAPARFVPGSSASSRDGPTSACCRCSRASA
jgi:hypothetical protein